MNRQLSLYEDESRESWAAKIISDITSCHLVTNYNIGTMCNVLIDISNALLKNNHALANVSNNNIFIIMMSSNGDDKLCKFDSFISKFFVNGN